VKSEQKGTNTLSNQSLNKNTTLNYNNHALEEEEINVNTNIERSKEEEEKNN